MKKLCLVLFFLSLSTLNAKDVLALASNGTLHSNSQGVKLLNDEEMAQVKGGYYWITGLVDTKNLKHDSLGNVYGSFIARGEVHPDQLDKLYGFTYFKVEYRSYTEHPRFFNYSGYEYLFIPYDFKTHKPKITNHLNKALAFTEKQVYNFDPKIVYASRAITEGYNAYKRYERAVLDRNRF
ncbi:hypothetical protein OQH60_03700 [Campylobacter sp. MIT 21-1685]|uniref:hypothetical protein n=1 Tax=unclassified Campylobacter TaxID=2593542 RepID=UPI00224B7B3C|nr:MULTISPECIES: hypothetical protein [unclassified Campylobacter]MCX2682966.1 hypothetical protein [Campylobacter sp. MIT 21-1684]MCX2751248.1 hypothetical protein [Campylobacter sp. MIT 21-1682]MCX2807447.1 hypothetical protein [Campylobacter sp. MIT 21-1685]